MRVVEPIAIVTLVLCGVRCGTDEYAMSNRKALEFASKTLDQPDGDTTFAHGSLAFVSSDANMFQAGRQDIRKWSMYEELQRQELVELSNIRDLTGGFTGWNDFFSLTQQQVVKTAKVGLTVKALAHGSTRRVLNVDQLVLKLSTKDDFEIVSNELHAAGATRYRVLIGTYNQKVAPEWVATWNAVHGADTFGYQRFRWLIEYDPVLKSWKLETADYGRRDGEFLGDNVNEKLRELQISK